MSESGTVRGNPYVGPRSLRYGESIYGRESEARRLVELLIAERIALLYSPSGAGKTSLIQAAVIPAMEDEGFQVFPIIRVSQGGIGKRRAANPYVLSALLSLEQNVPQERATSLEALGMLKFADYLSQREAARREGDATLLVFDQFEEILTIDPLNQEAKIDFFAQVGEALRDPNRWALFSMREDHVAALDPYLKLIPTRLKATFRLDLLNVDSAREAVETPAREMGVLFSATAANKLVDDLRQVSVQSSSGQTEQRLGLHVEPVQLQVVCYRIWEKLPAATTTITEDFLVGSSDVDSALAEYYGERVRKVAERTGAKERTIREWFDRQLITESGLRGQVMEGARSTKGLQNDAIGLLVDAHLVRGELRRGVTWLELAHDRMVKPIREDNAKWVQENLNLLQRQAALWYNEGKSSALCLRDRDLVEARAWSTKNTDQINEIEREFLVESLDRQTEFRRQRWRPWVIRAALAGLVLLLGVSWLYFDADKAREIANEESEIADGARKLADKARNIANEERKIADALVMAEDALKLAQGRRLDTALVIATEASEFWENQKLRREGSVRDRSEIDHSLFTVAYSNPRLITHLRGSALQVSAVAFSPDGALLATGADNGDLVFWKVGTPRVWSEELLPPANPEDYRPPKQVKCENLHSAVQGIAFSPDGSYMAVSCKDGSLKLWWSFIEGQLDFEKSLELTKATNPKVTNDSLANVAFSSDSTLIAAVDGSGRVRVWDVTTRMPLDSPLYAPNEKEEIHAIAFHPGASPFSARDFSNLPALIQKIEEDADALSVLGWSKETRDRLTDKKTTNQAKEALLIEELNKLLVGKSLYDEATFKHVVLSKETSALQKTNPHVGYTSRLNRCLLEDAFPAEIIRRPTPPTMLVAGTSTGRILIWKWQGNAWHPVKRNFAAARSGLTDAVHCLMVSPDGNYLAVGRHSGAVDLYNLSASGASLTVAAFGRHDSQQVNSLAFFADSKRLITASTDNTLRLWKVPSMDQVGPPFSGHQGFVLSVAVGGDKQIVASGGYDRRVILWDSGRNAVTLVRPWNTTSEFCVSFSPDATWEAYGQRDGKVVLKKHDEELQTYSEGALTLGSTLTAPDGETGEPIVTFSGNSQCLATTSGNGQLQVYDLAKLPDDLKELTAENARLALKTNITVPPVGDKARKITSVGMSNDASKIAAGVGDSMFVWSAETGDLLPYAPLKNEGLITAIAFSPDGERLVTANETKDATGRNQVVIWNLSGQAQPPLAKILEGHTDSILSIAFSPKGETFVTASKDKTLILWEGDGRQQTALRGHWAPVVSATFSPDGKWLASGSDDTTMILWDMETKQIIGRLSDHTDTVRALAFTRDSRLYSTSWDGESYSWKLDTSALKDICRKRANRNLTEDEWNEHIRSGDQYRPTWDLQMP